jgi:NAD(P)H-nitrite reductase large subunit
MKNIESQVTWSGREQVRLELQVSEKDEIISARLTGVGGPRFLDLLKEVRSTLKGPLHDIPLPLGQTPEALCLREAILKAQGMWIFPYDQEELCHCRVVPTAIVDQAICVGAHTPRQVSEQTSASTACGTCRSDVEAIIRFRLRK